MNNREQRACARLAAACGWIFVFGAVVNVSITVAGRNYQSVLRLAAALGFSGALLLGFAIWQGGLLVRVVAAVGLFPLAYTASEFVRRYHF